MVLFSIAISGMFSSMILQTFEKSEFATFEQLKTEQIESEKTPVYYRMILLSKTEDEVVVKYDIAGNRL